jgi:hypothetical protein
MNIDISDRMRVNAIIRCHQIKRLDRIWDAARDEGNTTAMSRILQIQTDIRVRNSITLEVLLHGETL